ncbi:MAG: ATP-binding protein, partial [Prevotella sp.]|nr:ATP-binding protein [Prevotella sp.]
MFTHEKVLFLWRKSKIIHAMLIGREKEKQVLQNALNEEYSQFIAVYGRRRVGKTFLIRETFENRFDFQFTGAANLTARKQLVR